MKSLIAALLLTVASLPAAQVYGIPIHFSTYGKDPRTVIFVHGWTCDETSWSEQVPELSKTYRVVTVDLPGHGKSGSPKDGILTMDLFARAIESVRAELKAEQVILVGHSMGTPVIIQYARMYPAHTAALVFVDGLMTMGRNRGPDTAQFKGPEGLKNRETMVKGLFSAATTPALQKKIRDMMLAAPEATAVGAMNAMVMPSLWTDAVLTLPILGLYAEKSPLGNRDFMPEHYTHMEYSEIPGTGHFLMLEKPQEFNRLLEAFLAKQKF